MECRVPSPCGRYHIDYHSDGATRITLAVRRRRRRHTRGLHDGEDTKHTTHEDTKDNDNNNNNDEGDDAVHSTSLHCVYTATLTPHSVRALTTRAGVRKTFDEFALMAYDALMRRTTSVRVYVETAAQMQHRIACDENKKSIDSNKSRGRRHTRQGGVPRPRHDTSQDEADNSSSSSSSSSKDDAGAQQRGDAHDDDDDDNNDDNDAAATPLLFLTFDYDVDYTRALFPVALSRQRVHDDDDDMADKDDSSHASRAAAAAQPSSHAPTSSDSDTADTTMAFAAAHHTRTPEDKHKHDNDNDDDDDRAVLLRTVQRLSDENAKLRSANAALTLLSREKMLQMQRVCDDLHSRLRDAADVARLRRRNGELRVRLREAEEARDAALATLNTLQLQQQQQRTRRDTYTHCYRGGNNSSSNSGAAARTATARSRTRSAGSSADGRGSARGTTRAAAARKTTLSRFDTPPPPQQQSFASSSSPRQPTHRRGYGEAHMRRQPQPQPSSPQQQQQRRRQTRGGGGVMWSDSDVGSSRSSGVAVGAPAWPRQCRHRRATASSSLSSSRASSDDVSASHERLYRAQTASSRHREMLRRAAWQALATPPSQRRAVFH